MSADKCMNCKRQDATISEGKARWCRKCFSFVVALAEQPVVLSKARREKSREPDYRNRNAPGGAWDHSER